MRLHLRPLLALLAGALALAAAPAAAQAASVSIGAPPSSVEDTPVIFTRAVDTTGVQDARAYGYFRIADANPCAPTSSSETGRQLFFGNASADQLTQVIDDPGTYRLCGYLETTSARSDTTFTVTPNQASVGVQLPATATEGADVPLTVTGTTQVPRQVFARVRPEGAGPCPASYTADSASPSVAFASGVAGTFAVPDTTGVLREPGRYVVCAYVQEGSSDATAEAVGSGVVTIVPPVPQLGELDLSSPRFTASRSGGSLQQSSRSDGSGTGLSFGIPNTDATVRFTIERRIVRRGRTRYVRLRGSFTFQAREGSNYVRLAGRIGGRQLARGRYRLVARASTTTGTSPVRRKAFTIVGRR